MAIDKKTIKERTHWKIQDFKSVELYLTNMKEDPYKSRRIESQECVSCFYERGKLAMQAFHTVSCKSCGESMAFPNSRTNCLCKKCAIENEACCHCMGSIDLMAEIQKTDLKKKISKL